MTETESAMNGASYQTARMDKCSVASDKERERERERDEHEISRSAERCLPPVVSSSVRLLEEEAEDKGVLKKERRRLEIMIVIHGRTATDYVEKKKTSLPIWTWQIYYTACIQRVRARQDIH